MEPPPEAKHGAEDAVCDLISDDEEQPKKAKEDKGSKPEKTKKDKDAKPKTKKDKDAKPKTKKDKDAEPTDSQKNKELEEMEAGRPDPETPLKFGADSPSDGAEDGGLAKKQRTRTPQKKIADPKVREILQLHLDDHSTFSIGSYVLARC